MMSAVSPSSTTRLTLTRGTQPQFDARDDAEQSVAANRQPEQVGMRVARAGAQLTVRPEQVERIDLLDDGLQVQSASVRIARERAGQAESIRTGLLLVDSPLSIASLLRAIQIVDQLRPLNPALDGDHAPFSIEVEDTVQRPRIDEQRRLTELLAAHRVTAASDRDRLVRRPWLAATAACSCSRASGLMMPSTRVRFSWE